MPGVDGDGHRHHELVDGRDLEGAVDLLDPAARRYSDLTEREVFEHNRFGHDTNVPGRPSIATSGRRIKVKNQRDSDGTRPVGSALDDTEWQ